MDWLQVKFVFCHGLALLYLQYTSAHCCYDSFDYNRPPNGLQIRSKFGYAQVLKPLNCHFIASPNTPNKYLRFWPYFPPKALDGFGMLWIFFASSICLLLVYRIFLLMST